MKSASAIVGFNNSLAYVLYLLGLAASGWALGRAIPWTGNAAVFRPVSLSCPTPTVWLIGSAHALGFSLLYAYKGQFVFAEGLYFQHVAYRVASGETPYVGMSFLYGPAAVYPVALLARLMPIGAAYALYYVVIYLVGLYALYVAVRWCLPAGWNLDVTFGLLAIGFFNPLTGLNYTFLRHLLPMLTILTAWSYVSSVGWGRFVVGTSTLWLATMYSPDVGVVSTIGVLLLAGFRYGLNLLARPKTVLSTPTGNFGGSASVGFLLLPGLALTMTLATFAAVPPAITSIRYYLDVLLRFSTGGSNTPAQVSLPMLALVGLTVVMVAAVIASLRPRGLHGDAALLVTLAATLIIMQRAAFSKPDVLHIAFAALPVLIVCLAVVPGLRGAPWTRALFFAALVMLVGPLQYYHASLFLRFVRSSVSGAPRASEPSPSGTAVRADLQDLVVKIGLDRAYYMHNLTYYSLPVYARFDLRHALYFTTPEEAFTEQDVRSAIRELAVAGAAVIADENDLNGELSVSDRARDSKLKAAIDALVAAPLPGSAVYRATVTALHELWRPFMDYLGRCYEVRARAGNLVGLLPRAVAAPRSCSAGDV